MNILKNVVFCAVLLGLNAAAFSYTYPDRSRTTYSKGTKFKYNFAADTSTYGYALNLKKQTFTSVVDLGVPSYGAIKDTKMLFTDLGELAPQMGWDKRTDEGYQYQEDGITYHYDWRVQTMGRCWAIAPFNVYHYFYGKFKAAKPSKYSSIKHLTQDEMIYWGRKNGKLSAYDPYAIFGIAQFADDEWGTKKSGGDSTETMAILNYMFKNNSAKVVNVSDFLLADSIVEKHLNKGLPMIVSTKDHLMVIDALARDYRGAPYVHLVNVDNFGNENFYRLDWLKVHRYFEYSLPTDSILQGSNAYSVDDDSDGDGIVDFDEVMRFDTDPNTDLSAAGLLDITKVGRHVSATKVSPVYSVNLSTGTFSWRGMVADSTYPETKDQIVDTIAPNSAIYSRSAIDFRSNSACYIYSTAFANADSSDDLRYYPCNIVAENRSNYSTAVYVRSGAIAGNIYTKGGVSLYANSMAPIVRQYKTKKTKDFVKADSTVHNMGNVYYGASVFPFNVDTTQHISYTGTTDKTIAGAYTLKKGANIRNLTLKSGAKLYLGDGDLKVNKLNIQSGAKVYIKDYTAQTNLYVTDSLNWQGSMVVEDTKAARYETARSLKVLFNGTNSLILPNDWYGELFAPRANVYLGEINGSGISVYGTIVGNYIRVGEGTKVYRVLPARYSAAYETMLQKKVLAAETSMDETFDEPSVEIASVEFSPVFSTEGLALNVDNVPQNVSIAVFDLKGTCLARKISNGMTQNFSLPAKGRYVVRMGSLSKMVSIK